MVRAAALESEDSVFNREFDGVFQDNLDYAPATCQVLPVSITWQGLWSPVAGGHAHGEARFHVVLHAVCPNAKKRTNAR